MPHCAAGAVALGVLVGPVHPARQTDATVITGLPYTITAPGRYVLAGDLKTSSLRGIEIKASDVELDGGGATLTYTGREETCSQAISSRSNGRLSIRNVGIKDFTYGILCEAPTSLATSQNTRLPSGIVIENVRAMSCRFRGIRLEANDSIIRGCWITSTGGARFGELTYAMGIELMGWRNLVEDNTVLDTFPSDYRGRVRTHSRYSEGVGICLANRCGDTALRGNVVRNGYLAWDYWGLSKPAASSRAIDWQRTIGIWVDANSPGVHLEANHIERFDIGIWNNSSPARIVGPRYLACVRDEIDINKTAAVSAE